MQLRLPIFAEGFARRLNASLGSEEALRTERWVCAARIFLGIYCYIWPRLAETALPWQVQIFLKIYLFYSVLVFILLRLHGVSDFTYLLTTLMIDVFFAATVTALTGGPDSPYVVLCIFATLTAAYRWGLRETVGATILCALLVCFEMSMLRSGPIHLQSSPAREHAIERSLLRGTGLFAITLLLGYVIVREKRLRAEAVLLARVLQRARSGSTLHPTLEAVFAEINPLFLPGKVLLALRKGNDEEIFYWEALPPSYKFQTGSGIRTVLQFSKLEAAVFSCPAHTWYLDPASREAGRAAHILAFGASGQRLDFTDFAEDPLGLLADQPQRLMVASFSFAGALEGRLILFDPHIRSQGREELGFLSRLVKQIGPLIQNVYLFSDVVKQLESRVRAELARELHDGVLQSLLSAEMQVEVLRRDRANPSNVSERMASLQTLIHQEALNLRDLIEKTKPLDFSPHELPDFLAEQVARFRFETGISVRLETSKNVALAPNVCHEIVRIVQEGLSNIRKHSGARNVFIMLNAGEKGQCELQIADDGRGFEFRGRATLLQLDASHRGPGVIKERLRLIGGDLTIDSSPGNWARLEITIPNFYG